MSGLMTPADATPDAAASATAVPAAAIQVVFPIMSPPQEFRFARSDVGAAAVGTAPEHALLRARDHAAGDEAAARRRRRAGVERTRDGVATTVEERGDGMRRAVPSTDDARPPVAARRGSGRRRRAGPSWPAESP